MANLPRGAQRIARLVKLLCKVVAQNSDVVAADANVQRANFYACLQAACAAFNELIPDRFVDPGQDPLALVITGAGGVTTPTRYRRNGGRLTLRITRGGVVAYASVGLAPFNATTGSFVTVLPGYPGVADYYDSLTNAIAALYHTDTLISLQRVEQTQSGNLVGVTVPGAFVVKSGNIAAPSNLPLWIVATLKIRTQRSKEQLVVKIPGLDLPLGKAVVQAAAAGTNLQKLVYVLQSANAPVQAYSGGSAQGGGLLSVSDNKREYRRITR